MSMFLGPIHHWLYNKIEIGAERATAIEEAFKESFGSDAEALIAGVDESCPAFPTGLPLEDIIGDAQIHPFLMGLIRMIETREGALVKVFTDKFGDKAADVAVAAAKNFGQKIGEGAKGEIVAGDLESVFRTLYNQQLDGMPCDQGAQPDMQGDKLVIHQSECLHSSNWQGAGAPIETMCKITGAWMEGFLKAAAPDVTYSVEETVAGGAGACRYCISQA